MVHPLPLYLPPEDDRAAEARAEAAFEGLVRAHNVALCNLAYRVVGSRAEAEDVVQEVFIKLWERADRFEIDDAVPVLYRAVRNRAISHLRGERARDRWQAAAIAADRPKVDAADTGADADALTRAIGEAVHALPERCRLIFILSREQHLSYAEIARTLGISVKTVDTQMGRALKTLRARLAPYLALTVAVVALAGWSRSVLR